MTNTVNHPDQTGLTDHSLDNCRMLVLSAHEVHRQTAGWTVRRAAAHHWELSLWSMFSAHSGVKSEINQCKLPGEVPTYLEIKKHASKEFMSHEEITAEIIKYFVMNDS